MKSGTKVGLIIGVSLVLAGCILFGGVVTVANWDFAKLSTVKYETNKHEIFGDFNNISLKTNTADITFLLSDDGKCRIECYEEEKSRHRVTVGEDTLNIEETNEKKWYDYVGINLGSPKIKVYLPQMKYSALKINEDTGDIIIPEGLEFENVDISLSTGDVDFCASASKDIRIKTTTGKITAKNITAGAIKLTASTGGITVSDIKCEGDVKVKVTTGKVMLNNIDCKNLYSEGSTGDMWLTGVLAQEKFSVKRSTGHLTFEGCDAAEVYIKTDTGDVKGSFLTDKVVIAETSTGRINIPKTITGGRCEITTDTGDINISIR